MKIAAEDQLKIIFTSSWVIFCYKLMSFGRCNARATFQRLMNKVLKLYLWHFVREFMDDFGIYRNQISYLEKLKRFFNTLDITLTSKTGKINFFSDRLIDYIVSKKYIDIWSRENTSFVRSVISYYQTWG